MFVPQCDFYGISYVNHWLQTLRCDFCSISHVKQCLRPHVRSRILAAQVRYPWQELLLSDFWVVTQRFLDRGRILSACVAYKGRALNGYTAFPRQGSHSEHVHQSLVLCVISRAFCKFRLYIDSGRAVLYDNYRGICNLAMMEQFWMMILFEFLHLFRAGCCGMCVFHVFYRVFLMLAW